MTSELKQIGKRQAFTLFELLVVITLIGVLVAITITRVAESSDAARETSCFHNRGVLNSALERYAVINGSPATDISDIDTNEYFPNGLPTCPLTGSTYTLDPTTHRIQGHTTTGSNPGDH